MKKKDILYIIGILISVIILFIPIINKISLGHDIDFHLTNMMMFVDKINNWKYNISSYYILGKDIARGFGYGTFIFYPHLSFIITGIIGFIFSIFKIDTFLSITYSLLIISFLSGTTMYYFLKKVYNDKQIAFLGAIFYISAIYFLCDIYVRSAIAESLTFIFIPLIFNGIYELLNKNYYKFYVLFIVGYVGMINSHLIMTVFLTLIIIIWFLLQYKKIFKWDVIKRLFLASVVILLISSPYIVPLLEHRFMGKYLVFQNGSLYTDYVFWINALRIYEFFYPRSVTDTGIKVCFNYVAFICFVMVLIFRNKVIDKKNKSLYFNILLLLIISMYMSSIYFPWLVLPNFLRSIQFPWRTCIFVVFFLAFLAAPVVKIIKEISKKKYVNIILGLIIISDIIFSMVVFKDVTNRFVKEYDYEYSMGNIMEYLPVNTINNYDYYNNRDKEIHFIQGSGEYIVLEDNSPEYKVKVDIDSDSIIEIPRIYYLGYDIKLIKDNKIIKIDYYEDDYGFIAFNIKDSGLLEISYKGTILDRISMYISIISLCCFGLAIIVYKKRVK